MTRKEINVKAWDLRTKLFNLVNEFKDLQAAAWSDLQGDEAVDVSGEIDGVACQLAKIHEELPAIFTDAARE